ncbi:MAG: heavy metal translocating P-type ATPase [Firmicutes bacterium]|nr:heavy metal translocating P-type ATPase [Bacillota bacterium]
MKKRVRRLIICGLIFAAALVSGEMIPEQLIYAEVGRKAVFAVAYVASAYKVLFKAARNIRYGKIFDENFLMAVASIGAFLIGEYAEAVAVMLFYQVGEVFEDYAVGKSRKSIAELMNIRPDYANLKQEDGTVKKTVPDQVRPGDTIIIRPGEKVPLDGVVMAGTSMVDTAALTGEPVPREVSAGSEILSGCINLSGLLEVSVTKEFEGSTVNRILELVESAISRKARTENFITRFAAVYTPMVVAAAAALVIVPPLVVSGADFSDWLYRALNFLVVSCPCALVISVPLGFFGGIGAASRIGVLVKGSNYLEAAAHTEYVVFDKTGTLTEGVFEVKKVVSAGKLSPEEILDIAASAESQSNHPAARSVMKAWREGFGQGGVQNACGKLLEPACVEEMAGLGLLAEIKGHKVLVGNSKLMVLKGVEFCQAGETETIVYVAVDGSCEGYILMGDRLKADGEAAVAGLEAAGITTVMLTGDSRGPAEEAGRMLGISRVFAQLLPEDKVRKVEDLLAIKSPKCKLLFVGDGINDAPVLARADVGVAMGGLGSDAAIEAADVVIMDDQPSKVLDLIMIAKKTISIVRQNIAFALGVKALVLLLSALGFANMWAAVFADVGVSVIAIVNSMRALKHHSRA